GQLQTNNGTIEKYCYDNNAANCSTLGGLYEWNEAIQYITAEATQGICPVGWHIPSDGEWKVLEGTVDSQYPVGDPEWEEEGWRGLDVGSNLKETGTTHWTSPNSDATNSSGFTALPGGSRNADNGYFNWSGLNGYFWSSSEYVSGIAWTRKLVNNEPGVLR
ncbi:MAG TPA: fibrobacter succinogenes major paralogous domain-containing protein, partial [Bacteroidales bacterium]|nr:fibrobacter succinogenes major paralogous domain-containing protein [Bacteroidales bacterium]